jgi:MFS family permease
LATPHNRIVLWRAVRALPEFRRLLELRAVSSFGDGLFQGGLVGALLFNPDRATSPWEIAGSFAVLYLPYSLLGPFAGALLDRWDRRAVLIGANAARVLLMVAVALLLEFSAGAPWILLGSLVVNGFTRFVTSGLSAGLPHVVPREQVLTMNSVATAVSAATLFFGAIFMLVPRWLFGAGDAGSAAALFMAAAAVALAWFLSMRFAPHVLGPDDSARAVHGSVAYAVATGWGYGLRTAVTVPSVAGTLSGVVAHRVAFGINTLLVLIIVRHSGSENVAGLGVAVLFAASTGLGSFLANRGAPLGPVRHGQRRARVRRGDPAGGRRPSSADHDGVRFPARDCWTAGEAVRRLGHAARRRRRPPRARLHRAGLAVLGRLGRVDLGVRGRHPRRRALARAGGRGRRRLPRRAGRARHRGTAPRLARRVTRVTVTACQDPTPW